jgi:uncharacterized protein (TIGR03083 family)
MTSDLDYLAHVRSESTRFASCLGRADPQARVPSCPDWNAADLLWHLTEVQLFWATIVRDRIDRADDLETAEGQKPDRPTTAAEALALFSRATDELVEALEQAPADAAVWTWSPIQTAGFVARWQATEAAIHRVDAEQVIGERTPIDAALATDGVDAVVRFQYGWLPDWAQSEPTGIFGAVETTDTGVALPFELIHYEGASPNTGKHYDEDVVAVRDDTAAASAFTVRAPAAELVTWLFGRDGRGGIETTGDPTALARFEEVVRRGID